MIFDNFKIAATPFIHDARCKCGKALIEVSNGWFSISMFCPKCENIYQLKLIKIPDKKINKEFLEQCRKEVKKKEKSK